MPANYDAAFARWLTQHGEVRAKGVNVLEFFHPAFPTVYYFSDYGDDFAALTETGAALLATPIGFEVDAAGDNLTTEQRVLVRMDAAQGQIMEVLRSLTPEALNTDPIRLTWRCYLDTKRTAPAFDPIVLYVTNVQATRLVIELECSTETLPNISGGMRYTLERFPTLVYL